MDFIKDFFEGGADFVKQCEVDGDTGVKQVKRSAEIMHRKQDENYKESCAHSAFLRMMFQIAPNEGRKFMEARLDVADAMRDINREAELLARVGDKSEYTDAEVKELFAVKEYLQMVLVGIRQFAKELK